MNVFLSILPIVLKCKTFCLVDCLIDWNCHLKENTYISAALKWKIIKHFFFWRILFHFGDKFSQIQRIPHKSLQTWPHDAVSSSRRVWYLVHYCSIFSHLKLSFNFSCFLYFVLQSFLLKYSLWYRVHLSYSNLLFVIYE